MRRRAFVAALLIALLAPSGAAAPVVRLMLDFLPNPNHVPIYAALAQGLFEGIEVEVLVPGDPSAPARLAAAGAVDVALTPQINHLIARDEGLPLVAIAALIGSPLGGLLSLRSAGIADLADLRGKRVGYSLEPLEPALWRTMLASVGVGAGEVELVNVGVSTLPALLGRHVDAIGAFRNYESIQVALLGEEPVFFPQEGYGVPWTYELVLVASADAVETRGNDLRALVDGLAAGIAFTRAHPEEAFAAFLRAWPELDDELDRQAYAATLPLYADGARHDDPSVWEALQAYLLENEVTVLAFPPEELYTDRFLARE